VLERQSQQMARLLDDLLEASRVTQNKIDLRRSHVDLSVVVAEAAEAVRGMMESQELQFSTEIAREPMFIDGDPTRLQQIQVNMLSNAAKYTPRGGNVHLEAKREGEWAVISVKDDGTGIPKELLESVFDLFVQSNRTLDRAAGGLGVGLTLARALVSMHGGTISAYSDGEGKGSEFVVRLPLMAAGEFAKPTPAEPAQAKRERPRLSKSSKVVVVEDNEDSRELLCVLLSRAGFDCHAAESGTAALALIDKVEPAIAVLDVGLPEMDGYEVARRIRSNPKTAHLILIALTGYGRASDRVASSEAGFDEHLVKPVRAEQLLSVMASLTESSERGEA
jgi:two-component system CheB/CheR fusion protein